MKTFFIGIDISKNTLDVAVCNQESKQILDVYQLENTFKGINKLIRKSKKHGDNIWFCCEHTGNYGLLLAHQLQNDELNYSMVPALEIKQSQGMVRGKSDEVDAQRIALYAATHSEKLQPFKLPGENLMKIKSLLTYRAQQVKISQQLQNSCKSHQITSKVVDIKYILKDIKADIRRIKIKIAKIEKQIIEMIQQDEKMNKNFKQATSVKGIGLLIASHMLVYTNNFTAFDNPRKFNCYSGLAPFEHSSGSSIRGKTKTSRLRNRTMKALLFNGANTAANFDPELKKYYTRKKQEGKPHQLIMNNIACKLVYRVFAVVKRDEPFVKLIR